ncbi:MAG: phytoene desaturase family protein [Promethearchaeota archaeon]
MKKKVLIIGSGIGGAGIAALLSSVKNYKIELFEKNSLIGGRFSTYIKKGWKIDVGCHLIANCENGSIGWILNKIGRQNDVEWSYSRNPTPKFFYIDRFLHFPKELTGLDITKEDLINLLKLMKNLNKFSNSELLKLEQQKVDMRTFLKNYTNNRNVLSLFSFFAGLYFVIPDFLTPASEWIRCQRDILKFKTSGYPKGGTMSIPRAFCNYVKDEGGNIYLNKKVKKIIIENGKAIGIETEDGIIEGDLIISNAGVKNTVFNLIGKKYFNEKYIQKIKSYEFSLATIQVKIALDKKITNEKMIMFIGQKIALDEWYEKAFKEKKFVDFLENIDYHPVLFIPIVSNLDPSVAPEGKQLIFAGGGCPIPKQGFSNKQHKEKMKQAIINSLEKIFPDIKKHILWSEITTPEDINNLVNENGCVVGIGQTINQIGINRPTHELNGLKNVYCCCADTGTTGIGGELAANSAINLFFKITKKL